MATPIKVYDAMGGQRTSFKDPDGRHSGGPTHAGRYILHHQGQHVSSTWPLSSIRWGLPLKEDPATQDALYQEGGKWHSVRAKLLTVDPKIDAKADVLDALKGLYKRWSGRHVLPATWVYNDFGHTTWYMFKDRDGDGKLDPRKGEKIHSEFIHTTQANEFQSANGLPIVLEHSHGCVHVKPADIDEMTAKGYLKSGTPFVVHRYSDMPVITVKAVAGARRYSVHFFPGLNKIVVYAD